MISFSSILDMSYLKSREKADLDSTSLYERAEPLRGVLVAYFPAEMGVFNKDSRGMPQRADLVGCFSKRRSSS